MKVNLHGVYLITRPCRNLKTLCDAVEQALQGGVSLVQYRDKTDDAMRRRREASALADLCHGAGVGLIINDDVKLAQWCRAHGVHLGRDDVSIKDARAQLGREACIGVSCYNDLDRAIEAEQSGADYAGFGSFYPSPTKPDAVRAHPDLLVAAKRKLQLPVCAIGGITPYNAQALLDAGADMIAVVSSLFDARDIKAASAKLTHLFNASP